MKYRQNFSFYIFITSLIMTLVCLSACGPAGNTTPPASSVPPVIPPVVSSAPPSKSASVSPTTANATTVLTVVKGTQSKTFSLADLKAMPSFTGLGGQMSSTGAITGPYSYKGIRVVDLIADVGSMTETDAARISASDGYSMTMSYKEVTGGGFIMLDPVTGKEIPQDKLTLCVVYEQDGAPLEEKIGPLRIGILGEKKQLTDGHWWVFKTEKIEVIAAQKPWTLKLEGVRTEDFTQEAFDNDALITKHNFKWVDAQNNTWEGIPLWILVGRVDSADFTSSGAFNDTLADKGYTVIITSADNSTQTFTSAEIKRNDNFIVANKRAGIALQEKQYPLRLVGSGFDVAKQIGKIVSIKIIFP